jgi:AhpD family alkylhydroperoxidase
MSISTHAPRLDVAGHAGGPIAAMVRLEERIDLEPRLRHLVKLRASQINHCAFCIDMHWNEAREDGDTELRLSQLNAWRESPAFDDRERAALALTESVTLVSDTHVPDDVWAQAERHFGEDELANLLVAIAAINFWNRVSVAARTTPASFG